MSLAKWVDETTVATAGFNNWEASLSYQKGEHPGNVYVGQIPGSDQNIIIIEIIRRYEGTNKTRTDWYFNTHKGKHSGQCATEEEAGPFFKAVDRTATKKNMIKGRDLQQRILDTVSEEQG